MQVDPAPRRKFRLARGPRPFRFEAAGPRGLQPPCAPRLGSAYCANSTTTPRTRELQCGIALAAVRVRLMRPLPMWLVSGWSLVPAAQQLNRPQQNRAPADSNSVLPPALP